jgi:hypothetical protein
MREKAVCVPTMAAAVGSGWESVHSGGALWLPGAFLPTGHGGSSDARGQAADHVWRGAG